MTAKIAKSGAWLSHPCRLLLVWCLCQSAALAEGLVYRISHNDALAGFLVGTMHSEDPRVTGQMEHLRPLIGQVDIVAIEMVPDAITLLAIGAATVLPGDQRLRDLIGERRFDAVQAAAAGLGVPVTVLDRLKPWAVAATLGMPAAETGRFLDMEIYLEALALGREVAGLETAAEQIAVFDALSEAQQLALLDEMIKNIDLLPKQLEELTAVYLDGDLAGLDHLARAQYRDMPGALRDWFESDLLHRRNCSMLRRAHALMAGQRILIAVGALHLGGESGLVAGLRRLGFDVERHRP